MLIVGAVVCCTGTHACRDNEFECSSHEQCIPVDWLCDADHDCVDGSDETNCGETFCPRS